MLFQKDLSFIFFLQFCHIFSFVKCRMLLFFAHKFKQKVSLKVIWLTVNASDEYCNAMFRIGKKKSNKQLLCLLPTLGRNTVARSFFLVFAVVVVPFGYVYLRHTNGIQTSFHLNGNYQTIPKIKFCLFKVKSSFFFARLSQSKMCGENLWKLCSWIFNTV